MQRNHFTAVICKNCGAEDSDTIPGELQDVECNISGPDTSPCNSCKELANLENLMAKLMRRRSELKRNINRTHSPLIRRMPAEIIAKISEFTTTDFATIGSVQFTLSSICSDWRQIVVKTPQLWSSIMIRLPFVSPTHSNTANSNVLRLATFIEEWLARSGQLPLHISISSCSCASEITDSDTPEKYLTIFEILNRYSSRWRTLNISIPPTFFSYLQPDCLSLLEQLHINLESQNYYTRGTIDGYLAFPPSPHLRVVGITRKSINFDSEVPLSLSDFRIQWDNVTHISVEQLTVRESLKLLHLIPKLVHAEFYIPVSSISEEEWADFFLELPIRSPLRYLSLSSPEGNLRDSDFFDNLLLPCLETLVLSDIYCSVDSLITCLERSACSLHNLSLENLVFNFNSLIRLLQFLSPCLKKLEIADANPDSSYHHYLSILRKTYSSQRAMGNNFLPHLEIFKFGKGISSFNSIMCLPNLARRNCPILAIPIPLRSVHIDWSSIPKPIPGDIFSVLQHLNEDGIGFTFE